MSPRINVLGMAAVLAAMGTSSPLRRARRPIKHKGKRTKRQRAAKRRQKMARASKQRNRR